jgi:hypothetical protein
MREVVVSNDYVANELLNYFGEAIVTETMNCSVEFTTTKSGWERGRVIAPDADAARSFAGWVEMELEYCKKKYGEMKYSDEISQDEMAELRRRRDAFQRAYDRVEIYVRLGGTDQ